MVDGIVPRNIGPIQRVKRVVPKGDKANRAEKKEQRDPNEAVDPGGDRPRKGTRIDHRA